MNRSATASPGAVEARLPAGSLYFDWTTMKLRAVASAMFTLLLSTCDDFGTPLPTMAAPSAERPTAHAKSAASLAAAKTRSQIQADAGAASTRR